MFGYYLELSRAALAQPTDYYQRETTGAATVAEHLERLEYVRKQTMTAVERFVTPKLQEYELRASNAQEEIVRLERAVYAELLEAAAEVARPLLDSATALARLDALLSFAEQAVRREYVRPELVEDGTLEIVGGRHPVVEQALGREAFMPNDTCLGTEDATIAILTGPNMAGKSTYLRQVALIVLLAQVGSFVPATSARLGVVDRVFARVGAQDDLAGQRSTFMVEMIETANILRNATPRSLLVLDEIGRGTSTFDGIAVARAVVEQIHDDPRLRCKTLFATHYHELADLAAELAGVDQPPGGGAGAGRPGRVPAPGQAGRGRPELRRPRGSAGRRAGAGDAAGGGDPGGAGASQGPGRWRGAAERPRGRAGREDRGGAGRGAAAAQEPGADADVADGGARGADGAGRAGDGRRPALGERGQRAVIRRLSPAVAARIAAGEVVERPASVVKELVENAIDAGATRITVDIEGGGLGLIRVADDGHGIEPDDLPVAFERHATSKLTSDDDLDRIATLGFRGEALPSIAAVADVECLTRTADEPHAWLLTLRGGRPEPIEPATRTPGTTMTVQELFGELPARRKFLRGKSGENGQIVNVVANLALGSPGVAFCLRLDGRRSLETPGDGDLASAMAAVHGRGIAEYLAPIEPDEGDGDRVEVRGCLGWGEATLPTRAGLTLLVNGRWVQSRALSYAVDEAYRTLVQVGRFPIAVLHLTVPPGEVDVNVHPRKSEVRLLHERAAFAAIQRAIRRTLAAFSGPPATGLLGPDERPAMAEGAETWTTGLRVLGQAGGTYIIAEGAAGIYLVDQHAAHERVLFERIHAAWEGRQERQALLEPAVLDLAPRVAAVARDHLDALDAAGFEVEPFGEGALLTRAVPAALAERDPLGVLARALGALADEAPPADWRERLAILFACHSATRAGDRLTVEEMAGLLDQLGEADLCQACSHGRPTAILLSHHQLAREFGRLY